MECLKLKWFVIIKKIESYPTIKLISVARFSEQKDHKTLFLALKELKDYDWSLSLVGKGPLIDHYKKICN